MPVINDIKLGPDPSGHFQIGHIYHQLILAQYNLLIEKKYQASDLRFVELFPSFVFLGARVDCEEGCPRPYVFKGCVFSMVHESPQETRIINFRNLEDALCMQPLEVIAKRYLELLEARREKQRNRELE